MDKKEVLLIIKEYQTGRASYRSLAKKYESSVTSIARMIRSSKKAEQKVTGAEKVSEEDSLPDDVKLLKEEIRKLKLEVELRDMIIEISSKELGIDLRKKRGAK